MTVASRASAEPIGLALAREVVFPALAAVAIIVSADIRIPLGLPGHRGLIWLTLLVAVAMTVRRPETVLAVGATSTAATLMLHTDPGAWASARYVAAAVLLCALVATPVRRCRRWLIVLAAAPIHLVALAGHVVGQLGRGHLFALASVGMGERVLFHLGFGLAAGLLGCAIAFGLDRCSPVDRPAG